MKSERVIHEELEAQLYAALDHRNRIVGDLSNEARDLPQDSEDQAQYTEGDEVLHDLHSRARAEIEAIRTALSRMDEGTWTTCSACGDDIDRRRLEVIPTTTLCRDCAEILHPH
jgi:RNA polymerase-binding transcription factor DksA